MLPRGPWPGPNDKFEEYASEEEWIDAWPDAPCPSCSYPNFVDDGKYVCPWCLNSGTAIDETSKIEVKTPS